MLVVISVIAILAALIFPVVASVKKQGILNRTRTEMEQIATALEGYKGKKGFYPPGNADTQNQALSSLYYELCGALYTNNPPQYFQVLRGSEVISATDLGTLFALSQPFGVLNSSYVSNPQNNTEVQAAEAQRFLGPLRAGQSLLVQQGPVQCSVLGVVQEGPLMFQGAMGSGGKINPWRYDPAGTNNPNGYDLWVDITIGSKNYRVSNWSKTPSNF